MKLESGYEVKEGDLLYSQKRGRNGVVRKFYGDRYVVLFECPGKKVAAFDLTTCAHLKHVGDIDSNPHGAR